MRVIGVLLVVLLSAPASGAKLRLDVDLSESRLTTEVEDQQDEEYGVSGGSDQHPTPRGRFLVRKIVWNPGWVPPKEKWARKKSPKPPGHPDNPMKRVKIFFKEPDYYIHGSDTPGSASHGCIRMDPEDAVEVAMQIMAHGGQPRPLPWYRRILRSRSTRVVLLSDPIELYIRD